MLNPKPTKLIRPTKKTFKKLKVKCTGKKQNDSRGTRPDHSPRKPARLTAEPAGQPVNRLRNPLINRIRL